MVVKVSVGIMAYNEEKYLSLALENILKQDFSDYEIIIADNASEDSTGKIAQKYAKEYPFIRYIKHSINIGAIQNYNTLIRESQGEYFVLAGAHDLWSEHYIEELVKKLDNNPDVVLAHGMTKWIDKDGHDLNIPTGFIDTSGLSPISRFNLMLWGHHNCVYGLYRLKELQKTLLESETLGVESAILGGLALLGHIVVVPEVTWFRRKNRLIETDEERINRYFEPKFMFSKPKIRILPHWRIPVDFFTLLFRIKLSWRDRIAFSLSMSNVLLRYSLLMAYDIKYLVFNIFKFSKNKK
jgi:glycosyltransferase involved in cell wall biosynthesis